MEEDKKRVLKVIRLPNDMKCVILQKVHSEDDFYFKEVAYCYEAFGDLYFKIGMSCFSDEDGDRYSVEIEHPKKEVLLRDSKDEAEALKVLNANLRFDDKVPALGWNMSLR